MTAFHVALKNPPINSKNPAVKVRLQKPHAVLPLYLRNVFGNWGFFLEVARNLFGSRDERCIQLASKAQVRNVDVFRKFLRLVETIWKSLVGIPRLGDWKLQVTTF